MKRKASIAVAVLVLLVSIAGCAGIPEDVSSTESVSLVSSVTEESSEGSAQESSSLPEETSDPVSSVEPPIDDASDPSSEGFFPWRGEDEPDLGGTKLPTIPEEGFSFLTRSMTLRLGESATVGYEFKPVGTTDRRLTWSSSDETVVKVEDGRLTTVGLGKATVTAETSGGRSAECRVTVVAEGTLSTLGALASTLADGDFNGLQFAKYDVELDGTAELFVREIGAGGTPVVTVYNADGESVMSLSTGVNEEWAIWRRTAGERYLLLSYTHTTETGSTRYVLEEVTASGGGPVRKVIFVRETVTDGTVIYYRSVGGELAPCSEDTYQSQRKTYFSENRQLPETELTWVSGQTATEVDNALRRQRLPG